MNKNQPIGVFDSGYGGLTVLKELMNDFPEYDFLYLGDNARTPYGTRSFDTVYQYTLQAVKWFFARGCSLVILACNTASAKALRNIQQLDLPNMAPDKRVLGVIRPSVEEASLLTKNGHVGVLATPGTVASNSYPIELEKWSGGKVKLTTQYACPMWVPIVENNEIDAPGAHYFVKRDVKALFAKDPLIDTLILGCTHYPILLEQIRNCIPNGSNVTILEQGKVVSAKLADYLKRHPEIDSRCSKSGVREFCTTENQSFFEAQAELFLQCPVNASHVTL